MMARSKTTNTLKVAIILLVNLRFWTISVLVEDWLASKVFADWEGAEGVPLSWLLKRLDLIPLEKLGVTLIDSSTGFSELLLGEPKL